jgi:transcriptional regulator with XRE-family HTH domain
MHGTNHPMRHPVRPRRALTVGQFIRATRKRREITAVDLAARCNVTRGSIHNWEKETHVKPKNFPNLSRELDIPLTVLWAANGPPHSKKRLAANNRIPIARWQRDRKKT